MSALPAVLFIAAVIANGYLLALLVRALLRRHVAPPPHIPHPTPHDPNRRTPS